MHSENQTSQCFPPQKFVILPCSIIKDSKCKTDWNNSHRIRGIFAVENVPTSSDSREFWMIDCELNRLCVFIDMRQPGENQETLENQSWEARLDGEQKTVRLR